MRHTFHLITLSAFLLFSVSSFAKGYNFAQLNEDSMASMKVILKDLKATKQQRKAYNALLANANKALKRKAESVVYKSLIPPSKDKHDYLSISRYWWPNENTPNGLPWVQKKGQANPSTKTDQVDRTRLDRTIRNIRSLALAYYFSGNEAYAKKGVELVDTWFINDKTFMNPHLEYAQLVPGKKGSRSAGIIDGRGIGIYVMDAVKILKQTKYWDEDKELFFNEWVSEYLDWLVKSRLGEQASEKKSNHGTWYLLHVAGVAWYINDIDTVKSMSVLAEKLIDQQIDSTGLFVHEVDRSDSFFYSAFNMEGLSRLSMITSKVGSNLWRYKNDKNIGIIDALNYLAKYSKGDVKWPHSKSLSQLAVMPNLFIRANNALGKDNYKSLLRIDPYKKTKYGKASSYNEEQEIERYLLNPQRSF